MGNSINKIYDKAMNYYQNGEIDKALNKCEEGISESLKNSNLLNLKGLLLYIKGDLNGALTVWKINKDYNNDEIAKVYLKDAKNDDTKLNLYEWAQVDIKDLRIDEAIEKLNKCAISDFNSINVNTSLALCYLRKGNCIMANEYIQKAAGIDKNNLLMKNVKLQIDNFYEDPKEEFNKKIFKFIGIGAISAILIIVGVKAVNIKSNSVSNDVTVISEEENIKNSNTVDNEQEQSKKDDGKKDKQNKYKFTTADDIQEAYIKGTDYYDENKYDEASKVLKAAYESSIESYLKDDILYLLALSYEKSNNIEESLYYYEEYAEKYSDKSYIKEVYYNLAILFNESKDNRSKKYAQIIADKFSNTIYYNSNIKNILN